MRPLTTYLTIAIISTLLNIILTGARADDLHPKVTSISECENCHNLNFIKSHTTHPQVSCLQCHTDNGNLNTISTPRNNNCKKCHGIINSNGIIPHDYLHSSHEKYMNSKNEGNIFSGENISTSYLNIENKKDLHHPWDIHMARNIKCIDCHFLTNGNRQYLIKDKSLPHLKQDPRKSNFINQTITPNHNLLTANCSSCHDPYTIHKELPYKKQHLTRLECTVCHIPRIYIPTLKLIDQTTVLNGEARYEYRGINNTDKNINLNIEFLKGEKPTLLEDINNKSHKIAPYNLISNWYWVDQNGIKISFSLVKKSYLKDINHYYKDIIQTFDNNNDGKLSSSELIIDNAEKVKLISSKLEKLGVKGAQIKGVIQHKKIVHGVVKGRWMKNSCTNCHSSSSNFLSKIELGNGPYSGEIISNQNKILTQGTIKNINGTNFFIKKDNKNSYIFGFSNFIFIDYFGILTLIITILSITGHNMLRYINRDKKPHLKFETIYIYDFYERIWHWILASTTVTLILSGLLIHFAPLNYFISFKSVVKIHNITAVIMIINSVLAMFYHVVTAEIRQFIPLIKTFIPDTIIHIKYYTYGIFNGAPYPFRKTKKRKLNPLQQITYSIILNIILPFQVITGTLIWGAERWPNAINTIGGLTILGPLHTLGSWIFISFLIGHIYLTTTGHTTFSNIKAMITGYDKIDTKNSDNSGDNI